MTSVYVYALLERVRRPVRIGGHRIEFLPVAGWCAAVERLPAPPVLSVAALTAQHELVIRLARRVDAILPARYGSYVEIAELERILTVRREALQEAFDRVRGTDQMTVRLFGTARERRAPMRPGRALTGTDYLTARRTASTPILPPDAAALRDAVQALVSAERIDPGRGHIHAVLNHLVRRGSEDQYRKLVGKAATRLPASLRVAITGPWPPFAFTPELLR